MLFIESKTLKHFVSGTDRIQLLEKLQEVGRTPLVRSTRLNCFEHLLLGSERTREFERAIAHWSESENRLIYVSGDIFCLSDHVLFLIFDQDEPPLMRAGIVYDSHTAEPFRKLDAFCRDVHQLISANHDSDQNSNAFTVRQWEHGKPLIPEGFKRFVARQDNDSLYTSLRKETMTKRIVAASRLEDENARAFLRGAKEAHIEGYAAKLLPGDTAGPYDFSIDRLEDAGLVEREVQVSCRKTGHALLRLPNANALVVVTVSDATCSECGAPVADEKVEEVIAPTMLASSLLEDGSWLISRLHFLLREMGVPESEIAVGPSEGDGYGQMMANICGESFLLLARDGDLTPAFARWAIDLEIETEASHLVVVATGRVHNQARLLLSNHERRRISAGRDFELIVADTPAAAGRELRAAFDRVSERVVAEHLCVLDSSIGLDVTRLVMTKLEFLRSSEKIGQEVDSGESSSSGPQKDSRPLALAAGASPNSGIIDIDGLPMHDQETAGETEPIDQTESGFGQELSSFENEFQL